MQHPILKVIEGGLDDHGTFTGQQVLEELAEVLDYLVPRVPVDDPLKAHLLNLHLLMAGHARTPRRRADG